MKKYKKDVEQWAKAASQDDPEVQYNFSRALSKGQGVEKDAASSFHWFLKVATQGASAFPN